MPPAAPSSAPRAGDTILRHRVPTRLWHWINALAVIVLLMSGLMILNAHPRLYWGEYGANFDRAWLEVGPGQLRIGSLIVPAPGVLGTAPPGGRYVAFPAWATIPSYYDLAGARQVHIAFGWLLAVPGVLYLIWGAVRRHFARDLLPARRELGPRHLWRDLTDHARLRFPTGAAAARYNVLQKLAYCAVVFVLLPGAVLTGLAMSPGMDAGWPWLLVLLGGRASARSIHFLCATGLTLFTVVHLVMVVLAGPVNEVRSMLTGRFRLPRERGA